MNLVSSFSAPPIRLGYGDFGGAFRRTRFLHNSNISNQLGAGRGEHFPRGWGNILGHFDYFRVSQFNQKLLQLCI